MYRLIGSTHTLSGLPGATADFLRALDSVRKSIADDAGLTANELRAMSQIAEADGMTPTELATNLELSNGAVTAISTALVARGLLSREEHPTDRRSLVLALTTGGHALMQAKLPGIPGRDLEGGDEHGRRGQGHRGDSVDRDRKRVADDGQRQDRKRARLNTRRSCGLASGPLRRGEESRRGFADRHLTSRAEAGP